jgi:hypothetical protein
LQIGLRALRACGCGGLFFCALFLCATGQKRRESKIALWEINLKILQKIAAAVVVLVAITYAGDYLQLRYRVWRNANPFGTVQVERYYAVHQKNNKIEFMFPHETQNQDCVHSLFPHMGYSPCWYLIRNREQRIDI